jgi:tRNA-dihydrouridine synthase B
MKKELLLTPLQLGSLTLSNRVFYSPLAGCSDFPFRRMSARYKPGLMFCEMVKMDPLVRKNEATMRMLDFDKSMHPIGGQVCGSKLEYAAESAQIIESLGFDTVDFNCGCPVDKVTKDGSGSGMLKDLSLMGKILEKMVAAVQIPVTVKVRSGWDSSSICVEDLVRLAEDAGAKAIFIHGRTREQAYRGPAVWEYIRRAKAAAKEIKVIGNGDVFSPEAAVRMIEETGCDGVLASRGTMGSPWLVEDILSYAEKGSYPVRTHADYTSALRQHFEETVAYHPEVRAATLMRKIGCWYIKSSEGARHFRQKMSRVETIEDARLIIEEFSAEMRNDAVSYHTPSDTDE